MRWLRKVRKIIRLGRAVGLAFWHGLVNRRNKKLISHIDELLKADKFVPPPFVAPPVGGR